MTPGYVYILTNAAIPGLVKIGRTERSVQLRAAELWHTGVPAPFTVFDSARTVDCVELERILHKEFSELRAHASREFFRVEPWRAAERLAFWAKMQVQEMVALHFGNVAVVEFQHRVDPDHIDLLGEHFGDGAYSVSAAMGELTAEELMPAMQRLRAKRAAENAKFMSDLGLDEGDSE